MRWAFLSVIAIGLVIGLMAPVKRPSVPVPAAAAAEPADIPEETVIRPDGRGHFFAFAQVDGETVRFVVDTGADMVALTLDDARRAGIKFDPEKFDVVARGASGDVYGERVVIDDIVLDGKRVRDVHAAVVEDLDVSLLGQTYLRKLRSVHLTGDEMRLR
ncbi:TIGR02281 family clan AA aspartic protease [Sphingomonas sp. DG1-23]|uniref:retropepsin-like aspartic protease family protein n=1 Tax=Sphingomonas sp. DG1-23 TaxID=3068316 RepID=UPI00273F35AF|nr:TIGR02281 family clan AA aspartic protease [Sphingomonas sp. DG1-23]MDP5277629.1 TIGR02281 family clan AA aspartic protease [Sphingomonas sp. DG1-23]